MRIEQGPLPLETWGLAITPQDYDGTPPLPEVRFDQAPQTLHPERAAVASYLILHPWISGTMQAGPWITPIVSEALRKASEPRWMSPTGLTLYAKPVAKGIRSATATLCGPQAVPSGAELDLHFVRSDRNFGSHWNGRSVVIPSNVWLFSNGDESPERTAELALGAAMLFSEDYGIRTYQVEPELKNAEWLRGLLDSVGIKLQVV